MYSKKNIAIVIVVVLIVCCTMQNGFSQYYDRSYALVIGIDQYPLLTRFEHLTYAVRDAKSIENFLRQQGFEVIALYDEKATRTEIISQLQNNLARQVKQNDRVLFFFAGHGYTETLGGKDFGYLIPYDGTSSSATYISMEELETQSNKMRDAKHQLYILDACYGGLIGVRSSGLDTHIPHYLKEVTKRRARQTLTAGGKDQTVFDGGGADGHSVFVAALLRALKDGLGDRNADGYITFAELASYVETAASNQYQTPAWSILPGHENGEFVFTSPIGRLPTTPPPAPTSTLTPRVPPPPTPTPVFGVERIVVTNKQGDIIHPIDDVYTVRVNESLTITVEVSDSLSRNVGVAWSAGHGSIQATDERTNTYTPAKIGGDYLIIDIWDKETGEDPSEYPINIEVIP